MLRTIFVFFLMLMIATLSAQGVPVKGTGWTNDYEHIFSSTEIHILDSIISVFEWETTNEIAIITIGAGHTTAEDFNDYVLLIHNTWGVGKKGINNGIVIGLSKALRRTRISNGYGIETRLTDEETKHIIEKVMIPEYRKGNMFHGTLNGLLAIIEKLKHKQYSLIK